MWATSKHDVYTMHDNCVKHWSAITRQQTEVGLCAPGSGLAWAFARGVGVCEPCMLKDLHAFYSGFLYYKTSSSRRCMLASLALRCSNKAAEHASLMDWLYNAPTTQQDLPARQPRLHLLPPGCKTGMLAIEA